MLTVTEQAAGMIRDLIEQADLPQSAGLRITQRDARAALAMTVTEEPGHHDLVLIEHDVAVFLEPRAARRVGAQTLDVDTTDTSPAFCLRD